MSFVVKTTTHFGILDLVAPHSCRGCGQLGAVVCECCKNNILHSQNRICPLCRQEVAKGQIKCQNCVLPCAELIAATWREGWLGHLIGEYKMQSLRAAKPILADILDEAVGQSSIVSETVINSEGASDTASAEVVVVPLPTIRRHVRERGLDHTTAIAKCLAKQHGWKMQKLLGRAVDSVQVGSSKNTRKKQAKQAYELLAKPNPDVRYLLIDDIWTTGASMLAAIELFAQAGMPKEQIFGAVIALSK